MITPFWKHWMLFFLMNMRKFRAHIYILPSFLIVLLTYSWFATAGSWHFWGSAFLNKFYDAQAESILAGRLDVPSQMIESEAIVKNNKYYGYFGPTPAVLRILPNFIAPSKKYQWGNISVLLATTVNLFCCYLFINKSNKRTIEERFSLQHKIINSLFILLAGLGSTAVFLTSPPFIYHEAIAWGSALSLFAFFYIILFGETSKARHFIIALLFSFFAINARAGIGAGPSIALLILIFLKLISKATNHIDSSKTEIIRKFRIYFGLRDVACKKYSTFPLLAALLLIILCVISPFVIMFMKFGTVGLPLYLHTQVASNAARLARTNGDFTYLSNVPFNLYHYFSPKNIIFSNQFPWFNLGPEKWKFEYFPYVKVDGLEKLISIPVAMPALFILSFVGIITSYNTKNTAFSNYRPIIISALLAASVILLIPYTSHRYSHGFFPFLFISSTIGIKCLIFIKNKIFRNISFFILFLSFLWSIYINVFSCFLHPGTKGALRNLLINARTSFHNKASYEDIYSDKYLQNWWREYYNSKRID